MLIYISFWAKSFVLHRAWAGWFKKPCFIFSLVICFFSRWEANGQDSIRAHFAYLKNEISIGYYNVLDFPDYENIGIGYKRSIGPGAIRLSAIYSQDKDKKVYNDSNTYEINQTQFALRLGFEFKQYIRQFVFFYGADASFHIQKKKIVYENIFATSVYNSTQKNRYDTYAISPFLGISYFITPHISVTAETTLDLKITSGKNEENSSSYLKFDEVSAKLNPLGIVTLNFHF